MSEQTAPTIEIRTYGRLPEEATRIRREVFMEEQGFEDEFDDVDGRALPLAVAESDDEDEEAHRCEYVGDNGVRCRNMARPGSRFCGLHERMDGVEVSDDPDSLI